MKCSCRDINILAVLCQGDNSPTNRLVFNSKIALIHQQEESFSVELGEPLKNIISGNGFTINYSKVRLLRKFERQVVTGLVVNEKANVDRRYIRMVRAALHAWEKYQYAAFQSKYLEHFATKSRFGGRVIPPVEVVYYGRIQYIGAIRGWSDRIYTRFRDEFNLLSPTIKIPVKQSEEHATLVGACWVIESDDIHQGTAFFLKGYGLVTCAHCIGPNPKIYNPANPQNIIPVRITHINEQLDLAIIEPTTAGTPFKELSRPRILSVSYEDKVTLLGYPQHAPGKKLSIKNGHVTSFAVRSGMPRHHISCSIVGGNSGGPVLNESWRVIGVAVTGADNLSAAALTDEHGIIPIAELDKLYGPPPP